MSSYQRISRRSSMVLIVPLWNWNIFWRYIPIKINFVVIVPLWNWNIFWRYIPIQINFVLIVPLWNWNEEAYSYLGNYGCFNRTFMELKFDALCFCSFAVCVLIVPLWNWNSNIASKYNTLAFVLIVPLWNWNQETIVAHITITHTLAKIFFITNKFLS